MVFLTKFIEKSSGRMISQHSVLQKPLREPDTPWEGPAFQPMDLISECCVIISILDFLFFYFKKGFVGFVSLYFKIFWRFWFSFLSSFPLPLAVSQSRSLQRALPPGLETSPTSDPSHLFLMFFQQAQCPLKSVNWCLVIGTKALSVSMQHMQKGGATGRRRKKAPDG